VVGGFKDLRAWQHSMDLVEIVYELTKRFPKEEAYGLVDQMRRAAVSIPSNIAEGNGRESKLEFRRFMRIAKGSADELETQLLIAVRLKYIPLELAKPALRLVDDTCKLIRGLQKSDSLTSSVGATAPARRPSPVETVSSP
jgi:four helix bundle protein